MQGCLPWQILKEGHSTHKKDKGTVVSDITES